MDANVRDPNMKRINNKQLAEAFIAEQIKAIKEEVGNKKVYPSASPAADKMSDPANLFFLSSIVVLLSAYD